MQKKSTPNPTATLVKIDEEQRIKISKLLEEIRPNWSYKTLAMSLGVSPITINNWKSGSTNIKLSNFAFLCKVIGLKSEDAVEIIGLEQRYPGPHTSQGITWRETPLINDSQRFIEDPDELQSGVRWFIQILENRESIKDIVKHEQPKNIKKNIQMALFSKIIQIIDVELNTGLQDELLRLYSAYGLKECYVAGMDIAGDTDYLDSILQTEVVAWLAVNKTIPKDINPCKVGITGGSTIARFIDLLPYFQNHLREWYSLLSISPSKQSVSPISANSLVARATYKQQDCHGFAMPFIHDCSREESLLLKEILIGKIKAADCIYLSVGENPYLNIDSEVERSRVRFGVSEFINSNAGKLSPEDMEKSVGDILLKPVDKNGNRLGNVDSQDRTVTSISLDVLKNIAAFETKVWILASKLEKAEIVRAAMVGGYSNSLVTTAPIARRLIQIERRKGLCKDFRSDKG